jgi:beta-barrel assembly-enhancing protease
VKSFAEFSEILLSKLATIAAILFLVAMSASLTLAQSDAALSTEDEIRAGHALFASFQKSQRFADTPQTKTIEEYLQKVGDRVAQNAKRKLPYRFRLDPHPGFRSAVAYPGGLVVVGGGVLALMAHEDELAIVLGHEIGHIDLGQCAQRVTAAMQRDHLTPEDFDKLSIGEFGGPYGKDGELAADKEGIELAVAAGYSPHAAIELLEVFQFLGRNDPAPAPRKDAPSLEERIQQARDQIKDLIKNKAWDESKPQTPLNLPW